MRCAQLNRATGLRKFCLLLYFITSVIIVVVGETNIFCGGMRYKKFDNHCLRKSYYGYIQSMFHQIEYHLSGGLYQGTTNEMAWDR